MSDAFFKVKSTKRSNPEARTTLDAIHSQTIQSMMDQKENIQLYKTKLKDLKKKIQESTSDMEIWRMERDAGVLEKKNNIDRRRIGINGLLSSNRRHFI